MTQCTYINMDTVKEFMKANPHATQDAAMEEGRCKSDALKNHTRCSEHGGGDVLNFFSRDMMEDEKERFVELYNNMLNIYNVDEGNLYVCNLVAMTAREMTQSHSADGEAMLKHIQNATAIGRDLAVNPKEYKGQQITVKTDIAKDASEIEEIVRQRKLLEDEH